MSEEFADQVDGALRQLYGLRMKGVDTPVLDAVERAIGALEALGRSIEKGDCL